MLQSALYLVFFTLMGTAIFLAFLPRLTIEEKARAFIIAAAVGPVVALFFNGFFFTLHDEAYRAAQSQGDIRADDGGLHALSVLVGVLVSSVVLWGARHLSQRRTYEEFVGVQQRFALAREQAKIAAEQREERMLQGHVQLAKLQAQERFLAIQQLQAQAEAADRDAALAQQVQKLRLAYSSYCSTVDPMNEQDQSALVDGFRGELRRPRFLRGKLDIDLLNQSDDPLVKKVLHGRSTIHLTSDD